MISSQETDRVWCSMPGACKGAEVVSYQRTAWTSTVGYSTKMMRKRWRRDKWHHWFSTHGDHVWAVTYSWITTDFAQHVQETHGRLTSRDLSMKAGHVTRRKLAFWAARWVTYDWPRESKVKGHHPYTNYCHHIFQRPSARPMQRPVVEEFSRWV